jgi:hypothetical protein
MHIYSQSLSVSAATEKEKNVLNIDQNSDIVIYNLNKNLFNSDYYQILLNFFKHRENHNVIE